MPHGSQMYMVLYSAAYLVGAQELVGKQLPFAFVETMQSVLEKHAKRSKHLYQTCHCVVQLTLW